ncbi:putative E3 ubiquitin-protein ligase ARI1 isoform X2 [Wolffia australiana]
MPGSNGYSSSEEDYYDSDRDSIGAFGNQDLEADCGASSSSRCSTQVITRESLLSAQREDLQRVMDLLQLPEQHARTLLICHRWDVDKIFSILVERGRDQLFSEAGLTLSDSRALHLSLPSSPVLCQICFEEVAIDDTTTMDCGHIYCNDCWTEHFMVKINDGQSRRIRCMASKCNAICDEAVVRSLVNTKDPDMADRFERYLLESYIEDNNKVNWCPSVPHCGNAIRVDGDVYCEVECTCGLQFCFGCLSEAHSPCSCQMWRLWVKKCRDESETVNWITANTKSCPKCFKHIEKNGGCNLVTCICGQAFCWLCGAATGYEHTWSNIAGHSCGRYKDQKTEMAKRELHRYMHYHKFYKSHKDSCKQETKLSSAIQAKISVMESKDWTMKDYSWLLNGLHRLFRSRRMLSYSYPFAFYMFGDEIFKDEMSKEEREIKQNLFEDQQQQLESNVERLSKSLTLDFDESTEEQVVAARMNIINLSVLIDQLCHKIYECIENDLLGSLTNATHNIAPYRSKGIERASELTDLWDSSQLIEGSGWNHLIRETPGKKAGTSCTEDNFHTHSSRRRKRPEDFEGDGLIDLNLPPNVEI